MDPRLTLEMLRASEHRLASTICSFHREPGYTVMRSDAFPNFYAGNALLIHEPHDSRPLEAWVSQFQRFFPSDCYRHITLIFPSATNEAAVLEAGRRKGFKSFTEVLMAAPVSRLAGALGADASRVSIRILGTTAADEQLVYRLHLPDARDEDWFIDEDDFKQLFRKTMTASTGVGVQWIAATLAAQTDHVDSALGFFDEDRLCRLQEVMTTSLARGKGLASLLIREVAARARQRGVPLIGLFAEEAGEGHRLYRKLGFEPLDRDVILMRY